MSGFTNRGDPTVCVRAHASDKMGAPESEILMRKMSAWHETQPLLRNATKAQRVKWHVVHAQACGCRGIPKTVVKRVASSRNPNPSAASRLGRHT